MTHRLEEPYSGKNPVPQIATKLTALVNPEHATRAKAAQLQDQSQQRDQKQTEQRARRLAKGHAMHVVDPVTGDELDIKNADEDPDLSNKGENVLDTDFPPLDWKVHRLQVMSVVKPTIIYISLAYSGFTLLAYLLSTSLVSTVAVLSLPTCFAYILFFRIQNMSRADFDDRAWDTERIRGLRAGSDLDGDGVVGPDERVRESAEWANAVLRGLWPILNPDMFAILIDTLEDIMQTSVPRFIHSVRISDVGLGSNAARITSIRSLPDSHDQKVRNTQERRDLAESNESNSAEDGQEQKSDADEMQEPDEQYVNLEISFAYRGLPSGHSAQSKARNVHLLTEFFLGIRGWYGFKVPIWVEVTGIVGTARARLQLISDPPFIKTTLVTLLGLPHITISVVPLSKVLPNVMNLPFISGFVSSAINTAVAEYVAPKSLTLDLQRLIAGDNIKKDTEAIGVLVVHIHRAWNMKKMDVAGSSDPYLTLTYSRLGRPLYSTRIIKNDCNPMFEETAVILVDVNIIRLNEKLSFQLWDSDRMSVDDLLGIVEVDVIDLVRDHSIPHRQTQTLSHPHSKTVSGTLEYTVGYYAKRRPTASLRSSGNDPGIPEDLQDQPELKSAHDVAMNGLEAAVLVTPPDPEWPSGILSVQVHEIRGLGVKTEGRERTAFKSLKTREGEKGQDQEDGVEEEGEGLPSSYCTVSLNDELVYRTRVKPITGSPIFNAGTERVVRDWRTAHVAVTVKDSRMRENDAVLGVIMLKLSELLVNASQITRLYSLEQGIGYGRIRISLLFRAVEAKLPPNLLGFDTGTLRVHELSVKLEEQVQIDLSKCEVRMKTTTSGSSEKVSRKDAYRRDDGCVEWAPGEADVKEMAVRERYGSALLLSFREKSSLGLKHSSRAALAMLWLRDVADNEDRTVEVPLWHAADGDYARLKANYAPLDGSLDTWNGAKEKLQRVGTAYVHLVFKPGMSELHRDMMGGEGAGRKEAWEVFTREQAGGLRESVGEMDADVGDNADTFEVKRRGSNSQQTRNNHTPSTESHQNFEADTHQTGQDPQQSSNTVVSSQAVENVSMGHTSSSDVGSGDDQGDGDSDGEEGGDGRPGAVGRFRQWRQHQKELHRDHKGIMQLKPARTAEWIKDNVEEGLHDAKQRFSMKTQKPGIETEV